MPAPIDRRLARETAAARAPLATAGVLGAVEAGLIVAQAVLLAELIAQGGLGGRPLSALRGALIALAAVLVARAAVRAGFELSGRIGATRVMSELRGRLIERLLLHRPGLRPEQSRTGELAASAVAGVDALETYFAGYLPQLMLAGIVPLAVLVGVARYDLLAAAILAGTVPILVGFMILVGKGTQAQTRRRHGALALLSAHFLDVVTGLETLRSYRREAAQRRTLADVGDRYRRETMGTLRMAFMSALVLELCAMIGTALVAATIGVELCAGALTLQAGLTVLLLTPELYGPLREVGQQFHAGADATAAAQRIFAAIDARPPAAGTALGAVAVAPDPRHAAIRFEGVDFAYPGDRGAVLHGLDLTLEPGTTTLLLGPSGAGKSTIARLLLAFAAPSAGRVRCGAVDLARLDPSAWQSHVAWLPQHPTLFSGTVADNVRLGVDADDAAVRAALAAAGALDFVAALPDGIDTRIGESGRRVSAGQRQRIALARLFVRDAPVVVLDEPTAHLDGATAAGIRDALARLVAGRTVLLIAHDESLCELADQVVRVVAGRALTVDAAPQPVEVAA